MILSRIKDVKICISIRGITVLDLIFVKKYQIFYQIAKVDNANCNWDQR